MSNIYVKKRKTNFEILRIISMLMIITLHYTQNSGVMGNDNQMKIFFSFLNAICSVGVNCFVLISGYFLIDSKFKIQKIINLWGLVLFYSYGIYFFYAIINHNVIHEMNLIDILLVFSPVLNVHYWFIVPYLALYLIFPFLNKCIKCLKQIELKTLLIIFFFLLCVINNITPLNQNFEAVGGHSILWFIFLYSVGAYIKLYYNLECKIKKDNYKFLLGYFSILLLGFIAKNLFESVSNVNILLQYSSYRVLAYNSIFVFIAALLLFIFFKNINITSTLSNKIISAISQNVFAVYLIHEHQLNRKMIWTTVLNIKVANMSQHYILHYILSLLTIFTFCVFIEYIRKKIFNLVKKIPLFNNLSNQLQKLYQMINDKFILKNEN